MIREKIILTEEPVIEKSEFPQILARDKVSGEGLKWSIKKIDRSAISLIKNTAQALGVAADLAGFSIEEFNDQYDNFGGNDPDIDIKRPGIFEVSFGVEGVSSGTAAITVIDVVLLVGGVADESTRRTITLRDVGQRGHLSASRLIEVAEGSTENIKLSASLVSGTMGVSIDKGSFSVKKV
jgi:hypothetical protein